MVEARGCFSAISGHISVTVRGRSNLTTAVYRSYYDKSNAIYRMPLSSAVTEKRGNKYFPKMVDAPGCFSNHKWPYLSNRLRLGKIKGPYFIELIMTNISAIHRMQLSRIITEKGGNIYILQKWCESSRIYF
jgi:hypothetical protein